MPRTPLADRHLFRPLPRRLTLVQRFALTSAAAFLVMGVALTFLLGRAIEQNALNGAVQTAQDTMQDRLLRELRPSDLTTPMHGARYNHFQWFVQFGILNRRTVRVKVWNQWGRVIYSDRKDLVGKKFPIKSDLAEALHGEAAGEVSTLSAAENTDDRRFGKLLEVYLPIRYRPDGPVLGAFEIYQTYTPVASSISNMMHDVFAIVILGLFVMYFLLFGMFRNGSRTIIAQQRQLERHNNVLQESYRQTIQSLAAAVDARDSSTEQHAERVTSLALGLGNWLGLGSEAMRDLERGSLLHDIGKIGVSDAILLKPGPLTETEWTQMRRHPEIGFEMLRDVSFLKGALSIVLHHHERWDGSGYPHRLCGENIPLHARLFAVIDVYDALTSDRPYRRGMTHEAAMDIIREGVGTHFDPAMVEAFDAMMRDRSGISSRGRGDLVALAPAS